MRNWVSIWWGAPIFPINDPVVLLYATSTGTPTYPWVQNCPVEQPPLPWYCDENVAINVQSAIVVSKTDQERTVHLKNMSWKKKRQRWWLQAVAASWKDREGTETVLISLAMWNKMRRNKCTVLYDDDWLRLLLCTYVFIILFYWWDGMAATEMREASLFPNSIKLTHTTRCGPARENSWQPNIHHPLPTTLPSHAKLYKLKWWWAIRKSIAYALLRLHKLVGSAIHDDDDNVSTTTTTFPNRFISRRILRLYLTRNGHMYVCLPACLLRLYYTQPNANWYECETQNGNKARMSSIRVKG